ncbi:hypothetical protein [Rhodoferax saidenbachensis]|nr:hypothetical protein [Rhodoferax saidenbachensis]
MSAALFLDALSVPRVGIYRNLFRTQSDDETVGAVLWGQAMAAALQPLICTSEVALRNRIHASLSRQASVHASLQPSKSYPWYDQRLGWKTLEGETLAKVEDLLIKNGMLLTNPPSPDRVVAELSLGVWPNILESQLTNKQQQDTFNDVFPDHPNRHRKHWKHSNAREDAIARCKDLQRLRNRIAHRGPIWPENWSHGRPHWTEMLDRLRARRAQLLELLSWICAASADIHSQSLMGRLFDHLCTTDAVMAFMLDPINAGGLQVFTRVDQTTLDAHLQRK